MSQATPGEDPYLNSNLFSGYYLDERVADRGEWGYDREARAAFEELRDLWAAERDLVDDYNEDPLIDAWMAEVLDVLGYGTASEQTIPDGGGFVDLLLFDSEDARRDAIGATEKREVFAQACGLLEAKQWGASFTDRFSEDRQYRDASHQVKHYLDSTPAEWGILTNGRKWRLYGTKNYETRTFYEVDLPELLESGDLEAFKYFYVFFRPGAFREVAGTTFLDTVWSESETAAQELGEDLQDNVFTALRLVGKGFVDGNDLDVDPDDEAALDHLKEQSLVLLYRLMFVLYAEARGLIDPDDPGSRKEYQEHFSLDQLRQDVLVTIREGGDFESDYTDHSSGMYQRLQDLFELVDEGEEDLGIPPYNGGLFDAEANAFLEENTLSDRYLAEVIYRLSTTQTEEGLVLADYADLDTRHLGSIYEGLLEHEFRIAPEDYAAVAEDGGQVWKPATEVSVTEAVETVESGGLYVVNDEGERKATGAYYTPDYVVTYIVEETVDPLLSEIRTDLADTDLDPGTQPYVAAFWDRVTDLTVLDPAMGSGHFLTRATDYLADQVMEKVRNSEAATLFDENQVRREISRECIYGVDIDGMAVELAKLSMWLETLAADQPLAFLDHHLKAGNSLVGSDIEAVLSDDTDLDDDGQITLSQAFAQVRQSTLEHVMDLMQDLLDIDNQTLADVKSMEEIYREIRTDPLYQRLFELANVHTAEQFGLGVPGDAYERMADAIEDADDWDEIRDQDWFRSAQATAREQSFFHWELEYPGVFFGEDGKRKGDAGFDAVIGNPPYVRSRNLSDAQKEYYKSEYRTAEGAFDVYIPFVEQASYVGRTVSYIVPNKWTTTNYGRNIRDLVLDDQELVEITDVSTLDVFPDADIYPIIFILNSDPGDTELDIRQISNSHSIYSATGTTLSHDFVDRLGDRVIPINLSPEFAPVAEQVLTNSDTFGEHVDMTECIHTGNVRDKLVCEDRNGPTCEKLTGGDEIDRYSIDREGRWIHYDDALIETENGEYGDLRSRSLFDEEKLFIRDISYRPVATFDSEGYYALNTLYSTKQRPDSEMPLKYLLAIFNSEFVNKFYRQIYGGTHVSGGYLRFKPMFSYQIPIPSRNQIDSADISTFEMPEEIEDGQDSPVDLLIQLTDLISERVDARSNLDLSLPDYLGNYSEGLTLPDIGFYQPEADPDSILQATAADYEKLKIGRAEVEREGSTVTIHATARYKPEDPEGRGTRPEGGPRNERTGEARELETDTHGYTETDPMPAFRITDLTGREASLVEAFVPMAVEEEKAGFRDNATKTISPVDRLEGITLPAVGDVADGVGRYQEAKRRAEELDEKIEHTDGLIDEIVYELYGLSEGEIRIVENVVGE